MVNPPPSDFALDPRNQFNKKATLCWVAGFVTPIGSKLLLLDLYHPNYKLVLSIKHVKHPENSDDNEVAKYRGQIIP